MDDMEELCRTCNECGVVFEIRIAENNNEILCVDCQMAFRLNNRIFGKAPVVKEALRILYSEISFRNLEKKIRERSSGQ